VDARIRPSPPSDCADVAEIRGALERADRKALKYLLHLLAAGQPPAQHAHQILASFDERPPHGGILGLERRRLGPVLLNASPIGV